MPLKRRSKTEIHSIAADLLYKYGFEECAPVAVEEMAEFDLGLKIEPRVGLHADRGVQGAVSYDLSSIYIENSLLNNERAWRLAIAHEMAHIVLHRDFIRSLSGSSDVNLKAEVLGISDGDNDVLEYEAETFVDAILVPEASLRKFHAAALAELKSLSRRISELSDSSKQSLAGKMAKSLEVPTAMVLRRLEFLGLDGWQPETEGSGHLLPGFKRGD